MRSVGFVAISCILLGYSLCLALQYHANKINKNATNVSSLKSIVNPKIKTINYDSIMVEALLIDLNKNPQLWQVSSDNDGLWASGEINTHLTQVRSSGIWFGIDSEVKCTSEQAVKVNEWLSHQYNQKTRGKNFREQITDALQKRSK